MAGNGLEIENLKRKLRISRLETGWKLSISRLKNEQEIEYLKAGNGLEIENLKRKLRISRLETGWKFEYFKRK